MWRQGLAILSPEVSHDSTFQLRLVEVPAQSGALGKVLQ